MNLKRIENTIETITTFISVAGFLAYLFPIPRREMVLSLMMIIIPLGLIINTVLKAIKSNWKGFIVQMILLMFLFCIMVFGIFVFTVTLNTRR